MRFKVGDLVVNREGSLSSEKVDCEGIIVQHWETPSMFGPGIVDNVVLYITFDASWPEQTNKTDKMLNFKDKFWELKKCA